MTQREFFGFGSINYLTDILKENSAKKVLLVTGKSSYESCGAKSHLDKILAGHNTKVFNKFSQSPQFSELTDGYSDLRDFSPDVIIGIGGGSVLDSAKFLKRNYFTEFQKRIPLVAIPTTAGAGSEATYFIVYHEGKEKQSEGIPDLTLPEYSILDPEFALAAPKKIAASSGLDALSQSVESYWCINSTEESKKFSRRAIQLILDNLRNSVNTKNPSAVARVLRASNLSGKAINITKTTACHAVSYPMTSYFHIPHGHAVALTLGEMLVYNSQVSSKDCNDKRGTEYVKETIHQLTNLLGAETPEQARQKIKKLEEDVGLETRLSNLGLTEKDLEIIIKEGFNPARVGNNPRLLTKEILRNILKNIF